jgi:hypothetical protein
MKHFVHILFIALSLCAGASEGSEGQDTDSITTSALDPEIGLYHSRALTNKKGYLENTKISIGTILRSRHFDAKDYNESHNGIYLSIDQWSIGTYKNSVDVQSTFVSYNSEIYSTKSKSLKVGLLVGVANGYEAWSHAQGDYMPILGISALWMNINTILSYDMVAFGFEIPLN